MEGNAARVGFVSEALGTANACDIGASTMQGLGDALLDAFGPENDHAHWFNDLAAMLRGESRRLRAGEAGATEAARPVLRLVK